MGDERIPYAAGTSEPAPEADRAGSFDLSDAEDPADFPQSPEDERARRERLGSVTPRPQPTDTERDAMVRDCHDAIKGQPWGMDVLARALADRLGVEVAEAERLLTAEVRRRSKD